MTPTLCAARDRHNSGDAVTAEALFRAAVTEHPDDAEAWQLLAAHLLYRDHYAVAEVCARRALAIDRSAINLSTLGVILHRLQRYGPALTAHNAALALEPTLAAALRNRGMTYYALDRLSDAIADYELAASILGDNDRGLLGDLAWITLADGQIRRGLALAENRVVKPSMVVDFDLPRWSGEDLAGKTLLVHYEQGFGDTIMWARYLPEVVARAGRVIVAAHFGLLRLFRAQGWDTIVIPGEMPSEVDFQIPFDSLAYALHVEKASGEPYLKPPPYKALMPVDRATRLRVGVVWSSGLQFAYGRHRSMPFECVLPLLAMPGVQVYSLSPDGTADIAKAGAGALITDMAPMIRDWADTAAIIDKLDVVVSVDTAPLHLAGALGKRAIGLMPFMPAWQWCPRGAKHAAWYDSVELLWPERAGEWKTHIEDVSNILGDLA